MLMSLDLVAMGPGAATAALWRTRRSLAKRGEAADFLRVVYLARLTTVRGPVPSYVSFGILGSWADIDDLDRFRAEQPWGRTRRHAALTLAPYKVRGAWDGETIEGDRQGQAPTSGPVLAITRARTASPYHPSTWRANPSIVRSLRVNDDVLWSTAFADRAFGIIGTLSLWPDDQSLTDFAYGKGGAHAPVIGASRRGGWLPESWFGRATVLGSVGHWPGWPSTDVLSTS